MRSSALDAVVFANSISSGRAPALSKLSRACFSSSSALISAQVGQVIAIGQAGDALPFLDRISFLG